MPEAIIKLDPETTPGYVHAKNLTAESAETATRSLQANQVNHIFTGFKFLPGRVHNHIFYHVLCTWALGAPASQIKEHADRVTATVLPPPKFADEETIASFSNKEELEKVLGDEEYFQDFVVFYEREIMKHGIDEVLQKYVVGDNDLARNIYPRLYHGYLHSAMHTGIGLEFNQPSIIAEGLAEASVHSEPEYTSYLEACRTVRDATPDGGRLSLMEIYNECLKDDLIKTCVDWDLVRQYVGPDESWEAIMHLPIPNEEPWRDRVWAKAGKNLSDISGRYWVRADEDLERAAANVINTSIYVTCAAMRPPHEFRIDFFLMHVTNWSYWLQAFMRRPSVSRAVKARMIEDTGRLLTFMAVGVGMPPLHPEVLENHIMKANEGQGDDWEGIFERVNRHNDDGHMAKFIRSLANGETASKPFEGQEGFPMRQDLFLKAANAVMDNTSSKPVSFIKHYDIIRAVGFPETWQDIPLQVTAQA